MGSSCTRRVAARTAAGIAGALAIIGLPPARADFAQLQWQYECLKSPDAVCFDATPSGADPLAPKPPSAAAPADEALAPPHPIAAPSSAPSRKPAAKPMPAADAADPLGQ